MLDTQRAMLRVLNRLKERMLSSNSSFAIAEGLEKGGELGRTVGSYVLNIF